MPSVSSGCTLASRVTDLLSLMFGCGPSPTQLAAHICLSGATMFGLGTWELLLFMVVVLLLFGSSRLPSLMRNLGKSATEFKKGMREEPNDSTQDSEKIEN